MTRERVEAGGTVIVVMAKAPVAGYAKTRLVPALGEFGSSALAARMLDHAVNAALDAGLGSVDLCCSPDTFDPAFAAFAAQPRLSLSEQGDGDLGARMDRAFARHLPAAPAVLLSGTDAPALDATMLRSADRALAADGVAAVFVPTYDGGYALVGLKRRAPELFAGMTWSHAGVMAATRARAADAGLRITELAPIADVDEPEDLVHLPEAWRA